MGNRNLQPPSTVVVGTYLVPFRVLTTHQTLQKLGLLQKSSSFVLFHEPLARTWVSPKPRQDDPLFSLAGKRHSTGGQQTQGSPCCVRVSGGLMSPDRTATEAGCLENCMWVIGLDSETEFSLLERDFDKSESSWHFV